ncbi:hypothetical protein [Halobacillus seohaensis]|uniref:Uncharacterized protein n=1 Tax=Halobacillus seohaensis TaxID=447421 RepID=A0ABW2EJH1_9BACI
MDNDQLEKKKFLEQQLEWTHQQDHILSKIEESLYEMKAIAEYRVDHDLTKAEIEVMNRQLNDLQEIVNSLEKQLHSIIH